MSPQENKPRVSRAGSGDQPLSPKSPIPVPPVIVIPPPQESRDYAHPETHQEEQDLVTQAETEKSEEQDLVAEADTNELEEQDLDVQADASESEEQDSVTLTDTNKLEEQEDN